MSLGNIRGGLWPLLLVFPLSVIIGDLCYFDLKMALFVICLDVVYYMIMCMINYVEWAEKSVSSMSFGICSFISIILIIFIQLLNNRSALYSWLLFLALSLFGLGILIFDSPITRISGSFAYGLGDGLGYIIIYYLCG